MTKLKHPGIINRGDCSLAGCIMAESLLRDGKCALCGEQLETWEWRRIDPVEETK